MAATDEFLVDLDPDQRAAVSARSNLVAVIAGAGSGKTRVLTRRIAYRIADGTADARHTLALTFTREAAGELRRRLRSLGLREPVEAGTFHSVMLRILEQRWADLDRRRPRVTADRRRLVREVLEPSARRGLDAFLAEIEWASARGIGADDYAGRARREGRRPGPGVERCADLYRAYESEKRSRGVIDFDDVLRLTTREMRRDRSFADALRWRFRHVLVDEAQDLNPIQHDLVDLLRRGVDDLFLVGDPAQSIYGFNGADPGLLVDVERRFPGIEVIRLPVNHRCTPQVVDVGLHALARSGQPTDLRSARADGPAIDQVVADDEHAEAELVARAIARTEPRRVRAGQVAVLARTNAQLAALRAALEQTGQPIHAGRAGTSAPLAGLVRQVAALGSDDRLRAFAHDTLDTVHDDGGDGEVSRQHERQLAEAVLDFLREHPGGDGNAFRSWVATTGPFGEQGSAGVELLTFHAAKGREWHSVIVTGVETGLVPHKSATGAAAKAEEGRLLYVALTRATDELTITHAARRGGYARAASPLLDDFTATAAEIAPPPPRPRLAAPDPWLEALRTWRDDQARRARTLPEAWCSDRDLQAIAAHRPTTVDDLVAVTSFGPITARRLAPQLAALAATL